MAGSAPPSSPTIPSPMTTWPSRAPPRRARERDKALADSRLTLTPRSPSAAGHVLIATATDRPAPTSQCNASRRARRSTTAADTPPLLRIAHSESERLNQREKAMNGTTATTTVSSGATFLRHKWNPPLPAQVVTGTTWPLVPAFLGENKRKGFRCAGGWRWPPLRGDGGFSTRRAKEERPPCFCAKPTPLAGKA